MFRRNAATFLLASALMISGLLGGCAKAKLDTTGFTMNGSATVDAGFEDAWQAVKAVLREGGYDLYTRDKRGTFVAYTKEKRRLLQPQRVKYTINLSPVSDAQTQVEIEAVKQVYGVTLLTYPDWHDRKLDEDAGVQSILESLQAKVSAPATDAAPETTDATPVAPTS